LLPVFMLTPGMHRTVERSEASRYVNSPSQIKHRRIFVLRTMHTLPIWSVRMEPLSR